MLMRSGEVPKETEIENEAYKESHPRNNYSQKLW